MPIRLVLADDHPVVLAGLEQLFSLERDFRVVARCVSGDETLEAVRANRPDILILDIRMPGKDGLEVLRELKGDPSATPVIILTVGLDEKDLLEAMRLGVRGVILKEMAPHVLVDCVRRVHAGEVCIEPASVRSALEAMERREAEARQAAAALTPRELEIVRMVGRGLRNKEIAETLSITEGTVKIHLHHVYEKLHLDGRLALLAYAQRKGLV